MPIESTKNRPANGQGRNDPGGDQLGGAWTLHPRVSLRPEPFGALAYHYDNRKLQFLRSVDLVRLVTSLSNHPTPRAAFDDQGIDPKRWPSFASALASLADSAFIEPAFIEPAFIEPAFIEPATQDRITTSEKGEGSA